MYRLQNMLKIYNKVIIIVDSKHSGNNLRKHLLSLKQFINNI